MIRTRVSLLTLTLLLLAPLHAGQDLRLLVQTIGGKDLGQRLIDHLGFGVAEEHLRDSALGLLPCRLREPLTPVAWPMSRPAACEVAAQRGLQ